MPSDSSRRAFLQQTLGAAAAFAITGGRAAGQQRQPRFLMSLAEWSFHKALFARQMDHLDLAVRARKEFNLDGVEYVNQFFKDKATDRAYLSEMKKRADDNGVRSVLIMCDGEGALGDPDPARRQKAVENHHRWVEAAKFLGCHSIRVNAQSSGSPDEQRDRAADGLRRLAEFGATHEISVIVENHGGLSSNGDWLTSVIRQVNHPQCGTLPDFGNFQEYDRYKGIEQMMPFAKGVSAKANDFDAQGNEVTIDYARMMKIVFAAGYKGFIGIEYEGTRLSEAEGVAATRKLLERFLQA
jgi:L-ribulose-5-phosphate 3-epimerase